jgi:hypothetical protein
VDGELLISVLAEPRVLTQLCKALVHSRIFGNLACRREERAADNIDLDFLVVVGRLERPESPDGIQKRKPSATHNPFLDGGPGGMHRVVDPCAPSRDLGRAASANYDTSPAVAQFLFVDG